MHILKHTNIDFIKYRVPALALSWVVILAGLAVIWSRGIPLGVEFSGGTIVIAKFDQEVPDQRVRAAVERSFKGTAVVQTYGDPAEHMKMIRVPVVGEESGGKLSEPAGLVVEDLKAANLGNFSVAGTEIVGPSVGSELTKKGTLATVLSLLGILAYIAFRFQFSFAVGAVVASVHDLLITFTFLAFFQYELSLNVIAAILTVIGYSVNDTIVIFDRVRENLRSMRRDSLSDVINRAVNQTLGRTIITAGTTLLSALALFLFGGQVLRGFAFTMIVGIITGTYSTVFIAGAIVTFWKRGAVQRAAATAPAAAAAPAATAPARQRAKTRKRAS